MAPTETKLVLSRIVVSAVFISLCVELPPVRAAEVRRCYWCGPLAEQVHRSTRAHPCSGHHTQITECDPGFPYCAVVATSPPYIESRYCVKLYQDECYSLYCNSTRTWRMTCPCRGDLCNGPNTDREEDAFAGLAKLVARTHNTRVRRALITTSGFISMNTKNNRIDNTTVEDNKIIPANTSDNVVDTDFNNENQVNETIANEDGGNKKEGSPPPTDETATVVLDVKNDANEMMETATIANAELNNEAPTSSPNNDAEEVIKTTDPQTNETSIQIDIPTVEIESSDLKTEIILMSSETTKVVNDMKPGDATNENVPDIHTVPEVTTQATVELKDTGTTQATITSPAEEKVTVMKVKPSEQLPTAEALQHNDTPSTKPTEPVTMRTTATSMHPMQVLTTEETKPRNNTAVRMETQIVTLAVSVILHFKV